MSIYYLIEAHTTPVLNSQINDVREPSFDALGRAFVVTTGNFPIRIPETVKLARDPTSLSDLLSLKYEGILANYPGFSDIVYDDFLDDTGYTFSGTLITKRGERLSVGLHGSTLTSTAINVAPTVVTQCVPNVEYFRWRYSNPKSGRVERIYEEIDTGTLPAISVSANNGTNYTSGGSGVGGSYVNFPVGQTGSSLIFKIDGVAINPDNLPGGVTLGEYLSIASWSVAF
jgi:hypothetical protein